MATTNIRFNTQNREFFKTVKGRVDEYFKSNQLSKNGNWRMVVKTVVIFSIYFIPYFVIVTGHANGFISLITLYSIMGFGLATIGLAIMHDANHGSYSKNRKVNNLLSYSMNIIGGHNLNWQLQHNDLHHTFTNIEGHDEDIAPIGILRFSPHAPLKKIHRFQFLYAWPLYGLMTFMWILTKDFRQLKRYEKMGMLKQKGINYQKEFRLLFISKLVYYCYMLVIPLVFSGEIWWHLLLGFFIMHFVAGLNLALIFQPAHVIEDTEFPLPNATGNIENDWAVHQMFTTANFAPRSKVLSWFIGGLNYQIEHHLFPTICHIHYKNISEIVRQTAKDFNYPYIEKKTFFSAIVSHAKTLFLFGREKQPKLS